MFMTDTDDRAAKAAGNETPEQAEAAAVNEAAEKKADTDDAHAKAIEDKVRALKANAENGFTSAESAEPTAPSRKDNFENSVSRLIDILKTDENGNLVTASELRQREQEKKAEEETRREENKNRNEYPHDFEYADPAQNVVMADSFRHASVLSTVFMVLSILIAAVCAYLEIAGGAHTPLAAVMTKASYTRVAALVSLQCLTLAGFCNLDGLYRGLRKLSLKHPAAEGIAFVTFAVSLLHTVVSVVAAGLPGIAVRTFAFVGCLAMAALSVNTFVKAKGRVRAFRVVKSTRTKLATSRLRDSAEENTVFARYLGEESEVMSVGRTERVKDFAKRIYSVPKAASSTNKMLLIVIVFSVLLGVFCAFRSGWYEGLTSGVSVFLFASPIGMLFSTVMPYGVTSRRAFRLRGAVLGEAACDGYENTGVVSFDDTEVFPPKAVKLASIKMFSDKPIDAAVRTMAKSFKKLGGSLSQVFAGSFSENEINCDDVMVLESSGEGLHLKVGGEDVLIGRESYLRMYDIELPAEALEEKPMHPLTGVLWFVCDGELCAKFYLMYALNSRFETILSGLYDAGICAGVRTCDPCIDNALVMSCLDSDKYPVSVIRKSAKELGGIDRARSAGLVSVSSFHSYLRSFLMVDKLRSLYRVNTVIAMVGTILATLIGVIGTALGLFTLSATAQSLVILGYQLVMLLIPSIVALFNKQ